MKKILQVVSSLERGGTEAFLMNHYREIDRTQYQFEFMVFVEKDYPYISEIQELGGTVFFAGTPSLFKIPKFLKTAYVQMKTHGSYDAVHCHVNHSNAWPLFIAWLLGIPRRISHVHSVCGKERVLLRRIWRWAETTIIRLFATHFAACSKEAGISLHGGKHFKKRGCVIPNGISIDQFSGISLQKKQSLMHEFQISGEESLIIGNISRFDNNKNPLFTAEVFSHILKHKKDAVLLLGGVDGGLLHQTRETVRRLGIEDHVRFIGTRTDVPDCLQLFDVYLFPSKSEGFGIAILESQAAGCRCFVSTEIPRAADLEIGLLHYMDLNESAESWAKEILKCSALCIPDQQETIRQAFETKGLSIAQSVIQLQALYCDNPQ